MASRKQKNEFSVVVPALSPLVAETVEENSAPVIPLPSMIPTPPPMQAPFTDTKIVATKSSPIWDALKDQTMEAFSLPNQYLSKYAELVLASQDKITIFVSNMPVIPFVETFLLSQTRFVMSGKTSTTYNNKTGVVFDITDKDAVKPKPTPTPAVSNLPSNIWKEVCGIDLHLFSIKNQVIGKYAELVPDHTEDRITLFVKQPIAVPAIETAFVQHSRYYATNIREFVYQQHSGTAIDIVTKTPTHKNAVGGSHGHDIWQEIHELDLQAYSMTNQKIDAFFKPIFSTEPNTLQLFFGVGSLPLLSNLSDVLSYKYDVSRSQATTINSQSGYMVKITLR
jgi:hypothetical protein